MPSTQRMSDLVSLHYTALIREVDFSSSIDSL